jgi:hypothetical protein
VSFAFRRSTKIGYGQVYFVGNLIYRNSTGTALRRHCSGNYILVGILYCYYT